MSGLKQPLLIPYGNDRVILSPGLEIGRSAGSPPASAPQPIATLPVIPDRPIGPIPIAVAPSIEDASGQENRIRGGGFLV